ncbi:hypothetical protein KAS08_03815 [Candidatus Pacearchaeota archaeon]|nr:hypothetical protein [Candidatus Pacearchaeota archaeon]
MAIKNSEQYFHTCDNTELKSVKDMLAWMRESNDDSFFNHINSKRNDFAGWISTILKDNVLAKKIDKLKDREEIINAIEERIDYKNKKKNKKKNIISKLKEAIMNE